MAPSDGVNRACVKLCPFHCAGEDLVWALQRRHARQQYSEAAGCKFPSMLRAVVSKCSEKPEPAWCSRTEWWLDRVPAEMAICSRRASCAVRPGRSGFILEGSVPFGGLILGLFLVVISTGVPLGLILDVTQASCLSLACLKASAGFIACDACAAAMRGLTYARRSAQDL